MALSVETRLSLYRSMLRIRLVEERIESVYHLDEMKTPIHLCIGQEAVSVGVCGALERDDYIQSNHRSHGHYLAKGGDLPAMIAELYCRQTGCSRGRGGSMHLIDTAVGHLGSSSIVGGGIPIATGLALACQMRGESRISVTFFGDGAADEGVLYESLNFAMLRKLPVIYVLENNQWSVCSRVSRRQDGPNVYHSIAPERLLTACLDGNDVEAIYTTTQRAVARARGGQGPAFLECVTYRVRGHAGSYSDAKLGYRTAEEIREWEQDRCPIARLRQALLEAEPGLGPELEAMRQQIAMEIDAAFAFAQASPLPPPEDAPLHVFRES